MAQFSGRVESLIRVPTGGAAVSASTSAQSSAVTVTVPAGSYFHTAAGSVDSLIDELESQLNTDCPPSSGAWTVSLNTSTGLVTIACDSPAAVAFTSTALRDVLGFAYDFGAPQTAAQLTAALGGYGVFTGGAGYLCNESSGNLASVFGSPATLTAASTPTYSNLGPRGGTDKAVGFNSASDAFTGGAADFDIGSNDLIVALVGKWSGLPAAFGTVASKVAAALASGWVVYSNDTGSAYGLVTQVSGGAAFSSTVGAAGYCVGEWHVALAVVDRSTGKLRFGTQGLTSGTQTLGAEATCAGSFATAASFALGASAWVTGLTQFQLGAIYVVTGSGVATGLSANLSTALTNFAAQMKSQTGTKSAHGIFVPDCPLSIEGDPAQAPRVTDTRYTSSPTGGVLGLSGNYLLRHRGVMWTHVPRSQVWESAATYANGSYETFALDAFYGQGHAWFTPASPISIWWDDAGTVRNVGYTYNSSAGVPGWAVVNVSSTEPKKSIEGWTGLFRIELGDIIAVGG